GEVVPCASAPLNAWVVGNHASGEHEGFLSSSQRFGECDAGGDQEGVSQAGEAVPSRRESRESGGGGAVQGDRGSVRGPLRPGEEEAVRPAEEARRSGRVRFLVRQQAGGGRGARVERRVQLRRPVE